MDDKVKLQTDEHNYYHCWIKLHIAVLNSNSGSLNFARVDPFAMDSCFFSSVHWKSVKQEMQLVPHE
jgi:hypothetical protein